MANIRRVALVVILVPWLFAAGQQGGDKGKKKKDDGPADGLKALEHKDPRVRYDAADTLAKLGPIAKFALPELKNLHADPDMLVRVKAVEATLRIEPKTPVRTLLPILTEALTDKQASVRAAAPLVLALLGERAKPAIKPLIALINDPEIDVSINGVMALGDLGPIAKEACAPLLDWAQKTKQRDGFLLEAFVGSTLGKLGPDTIPQLVEQLKTPKFPRKAMLLTSLGDYGEQAKDAISIIVPLLSEKDLALAATRTLGRMGPAAKDAVSKLEAAFNNGDDFIKLEVVRSLWRIDKQNKWVGHAIASLESGEAALRDLACETVAELGPKAKTAVPVLRTMLKEDFVAQRVTVLKALQAIGVDAKDAIPDVEKVLDAPDLPLRIQAAVTYRKIGGPVEPSLKVFERLFERANTGTRIQAAQAVRMLGPDAKSLLPVLVQTYQETESEDLRAALGAALDAIDPGFRKKKTND
jgi:HEAT repeat protein